MQKEKEELESRRKSGSLNDPGLHFVMIDNPFFNFLLRFSLTCLYDFILYVSLCAKEPFF